MHSEGNNIIIYIIILCGAAAQRGPWPSLFEVSWSHTKTHHSRYDSSGRVISSSQRPLPDNTQHSRQTNIHAPRGIRTHDLSKRAAADLRLRSRDYWDRPAKEIIHRQEVNGRRLVHKINTIATFAARNISKPMACCSMQYMWRHHLNSCSDPVFKITRVSKLATCPGQTNTVLVKLTDHKKSRYLKSGDIEE